MRRFIYALVAVPLTLLTLACAQPIAVTPTTQATATQTPRPPITTPTPRPAERYSMESVLDCSYLFDRFKKLPSEKKGDDFSTYVNVFNRSFLEAKLQIITNPRTTLDTYATENSPIVSYTVKSPIALQSEKLGDIKRIVEDPERGLCELPSAFK